MPVWFNPCRCGAETRQARDFKHGVWHRVRTLIATLDVVLWAERSGLESVLVIEGDARPVMHDSPP